MRIRSLLLFALPSILGAAAAQLCPTAGPEVMARFGFLVTMGPDIDALHAGIYPGAPVPAQAQNIGNNPKYVYQLNDDAVNLTPASVGSAGSDAAGMTAGLSAILNGVDPGLTAAILNIYNKKGRPTTSRTARGEVKVSEKRGAISYKPLCPDSLFESTSNCLVYLSQRLVKAARTQNFVGLTAANLEAAATNVLAAEIELERIHARQVMRIFLGEGTYGPALKAAVTAATVGNTAHERIAAGIAHIESLNLPSYLESPLIYCLAVDGRSGDFDFTHADPLNGAAALVEPQLKAARRAWFAVVMDDLVNLGAITAQERGAYVAEFNGYIQARNILDVLLTARARIAAADSVGGIAEANRLYPAGSTTSRPEGDVDTALAAHKELLSAVTKLQLTDEESEMVGILSELTFHADDAELAALKGAITDVEGLYSDAGKSAALTAYTTLKALANGYSDAQALPAMVAASAALTAAGSGLPAVLTTQLADINAATATPASIDLTHVFDATEPADLDAAVDSLSSVSAYLGDIATAKQRLPLVTPEVLATTLTDYIQGVASRNKLYTAATTGYFTQYAGGGNAININTNADVVALLDACYDLVVMGGLAQDSDDIAAARAHYTALDPAAALAAPHVIAARGAAMPFVTGTAASNVASRTVIEGTLNAAVQPVLTAIMATLPA